MMELPLTIGSPDAASKYSIIDRRPLGHAPPRGWRFSTFRGSMEVARSGEKTGQERLPNSSSMLCLRDMVLIRLRVLFLREEPLGLLGGWIYYGRVVSRWTFGLFDLGHRASGNAESSGGTQFAVVVHGCDAPDKPESPSLADSGCRVGPSLYKWRPGGRIR
jgi:hypothetical protein